MVDNIHQAWIVEWHRLRRLEGDQHRRAGMLRRILDESQPLAYWDLLDLVAQMVVVNATYIETLQQLRQHLKQRPDGLITEHSDFYAMART